MPTEIGFPQSPLDLPTMSRLLGDLAAAHGKPFGPKEQRQAEVYQSALADCTRGEVAGAVTRACRELERFPRPAQLRTFILADRPKREGPKHDAADGCRDCGTAYQWRRLPHQIPGYEDRQCDCGWRAFVQTYATEQDLEAMGPEDPFAADELRRRAAKKAREACAA